MQGRPIAFMGITRERFRAIRARVRVQANVEIVGDTGTASGGGYKFQWSYDERSKVLTVQLLSKPFWVRAETAAAKLRDLVEAQ